MNKLIIDSKLRRESSIQHSGFLKLYSIPLLKNQNYYVVNVPLDGDAPKQYIKAYFYNKKGIWKRDFNKWDGYYVKFGGKSYPHESVIEFGINQIGEALGLKMNKTKLLMINEQVRFLSKDFIVRGSTKLIHGVEILHEYFEDKEFVDQINENRKQRRELLTFDVIENAFLHVFPKQSKELVLNLIQLITFDSIIGNNDRHFYNWGVIGHVEKNVDENVEFAPIYDTARGLLWNVVEKKVIEMHNQYMQGSTDQLTAFLNRSKPRFSYEGNAQSNHFELISFLAQRDVDYKNAIAPLVTETQEYNAKMKLNDAISCYISPERLFLMTEILKFRFQKLRSVIHD